jgi:hypothetical protein
MQTRLEGLLATVLLATTLVSCSITRSVEPLPAMQLDQVYVLDNPAVFMESFRPALVKQLNERGIKTTVFTGSPPPACRYRLEYVANWQWDINMYVTYIELRIYDVDHKIGSAIYNARNGGGRPDKFGPAEDKLSSILTPLFEHVTAPPAP